MKLSTQILMLLFVLVAYPSTGQNSVNTTESCYEGLRREGIYFLQQKQYNDAVNSFFSAYRCTDRPNTHDIDQLMGRVINNLKGVATKAQLDAAEAEQARAGEEVARGEAERAQAQAETYALEAEESAKEAESLRLVLLADIEREKNNFPAALSLAYVAWKLSTPENRPEAFNNFAKVVRDSFVRSIPFVDNLHQLDVQPGYVFFRDERGVSVWEEGSWRLVRNFLDSPRYLPIPGHPEMILQGEETLDALRLFNVATQGLFSFNDRHAERITYASATDAGYLTSSCDNTCMIWNEEGELQARLEGHTGNIYQHLYVPEQRKIVTRSSDGSLKCWSADGNLLQELSRSSYFQLLTSSSTHVLAADARGQLFLWPRENLADSPHSWKISDVPVDRVSFFQPSEDVLATKDIKGDFKLWQKEGKPVELAIKLEDIKDFVIVPENDLLLAWKANGMCFLLNSKGELVDEWSVQIDDLTTMVYDPKAKSILASGRDENTSSVQLLDLRGEPLLRWELPSTSNSKTAHFSSNGEWILIPNIGKKIIEFYPLPTNILSKLSRAEAAFITDKILEDYQIRWWDQDE